MRRGGDTASRRRGTAVAATATVAARSLGLGRRRPGAERPLKGLKSMEAGSQIRKNKKLVFHYKKTMPWRNLRVFFEIFANQCFEDKFLRIVRMKKREIL